MDRDNSIAALNLLSERHVDPIENPARAILGRALMGRVPNPDAMAAVEAEGGPLLLVLAAESLYLSSVVKVHAEAASGGHGVRIERWSVREADASIAVTEHYEGQIETLIVRRWAFAFGRGRSIEFETRMYPNGHSPEEEFAVCLATQLGWKV